MLPKICFTTEENYSYDSRFSENRLRKKVEVLKAKRDEIEMLKRQAQQKDDKLKTMEKQFNSMQSQLKSLLTAVTNMNDQNKVNEFAKTLFDSGIVKKG
jgi:seryl-tRNA synthetase